MITGAIVPTEPRYIVEITSAISRLKLNKAAGTDGVCPELLKYDAEEVASALRPLLLQIWKTNKIYSIWEERLIISIPKKGDLSRSKNCRGITLLKAVIKVLIFIILERVAAVLNTILRRAKLFQA